MALGILSGTKKKQINQLFQRLFLDAPLIPEGQIEEILGIYKKHIKKQWENVFTKPPSKLRAFLQYIARETKMVYMERKDLFCYDININKLSYYAMKELLLIPLKVSEEEVVIATATPFAAEIVYIREQLTDRTKKFVLYLCHPADILTYLERSFKKDHAQRAIYELPFLFPYDSAWETLSKPQVAIIWVMISMLFSFGIFFPRLTFETIIVLLNLIYFLILPIRFLITWKGFRRGEAIEITKEELQNIDEENLPHYSIFVPLYKEARIFPELFKNLKAIDYPRNKMEVKFLLEEDDEETIESAKREGLFLDEKQYLQPNNINENLQPIFEAITVPRSDVRTKPRVCNYALYKALGKYCVIYDAEDQPDPDQLKKAVLGFERVPKDVICLQAKLAFYNNYQNWLTRFFSIEYLCWFNYFLSGLDRASYPIPLGGTSNHLKTEWLKSLGGWDPYNVTEDADLGVRIYKRDKKVAMINSYTWEEAVSSTPAWFRQRSRWQKGYLQTYLVHMRRLWHFIKKAGFKKFLYFQIVIGGNFFPVLANPILWFGMIITLLMPTDYFLFNIPWVAAICLFNLIIGNLAYIGIHILSVFPLKRWNLLPWAFMIPVYWVLLSIGAWKGAIQLLHKPHFWEKTEHGFAKRDAMIV